MTNPVVMSEIWRGGLLESLHMGHAVICDANGEIVQAWGDPDAVILPRSSAKMIQALPLIESGAADAQAWGCVATGDRSASALQGRGDDTRSRAGVPVG